MSDRDGGFRAENDDKNRESNEEFQEMSKRPQRYKQVIILRRDIIMSPGKACAQTAHAAIEAYKRAGQSLRDMWEKAGYHKVILAANSEEELNALFDKADDANLPASIIRDFGLTELKPGTITAVAIGPALVEDVDRITKSLKLY